MPKRTAPGKPDMDEREIIDGIGALARSNGVSGPVEIEALKRVRGGNSSEIWAFDGSWSENGAHVTRPLILRSGADNEFSFAGRDMEYRVLKALERSDVKVPRIYWFDPAGTHFGRQTMVMERSPGIAERLVMTDRNGLGLDQSARVALGQEIIDLLGRIHAFEAAPGELDSPTDQAHPAADRLRAHDQAIEKLELEPMVELRIASWWLWKNLPPPPERLTIVHGDYRPANMLVEKGRVTAILDWEFASVGDPLEDLGWYLTPYYAKEHLIPGAFSYDDVIARYEQATGTVVDRAAIRFWGVFAIYKLAYMTIAALRWMAEGDASRMTSSGLFILKPLLAAIADATSDKANHSKDGAR
nr:phosphotransferase family protein [Sphingomonas sp. CDS-1]